MADGLAAIWYYQCWLIAIYFAAGLIKNNVYAAAACAFLAYVAVTWYPLIKIAHVVIYHAR